MWKIRKHFKFDAAHKLEKHSGDCKNLHGHTWHGWVEVKAHELDAENMVCDFKFIKDAVNALLTKFDHAMLNEVMNEVQPTSEVIAYSFFQYLDPIISRERKVLSAVCIQETGGSECIYEKV